MEKEQLLKEYNDLLLCNDTASLFKLFDIITMLQDDEKLSSFIINNKQKLMKEDPILFIGKHVHYYLCEDRINEGIALLKQYQDAPFISVKVEEFMQELMNEINKSITPRKPSSYNFENVKIDINSNQPERIAKAIKYLSESNIRNHLNYLKTVLIDTKLNYKFKILIEFILIEQGVNERISIRKDDGDTFSIIPANMVLPFETNYFKEGESYLSSCNESPSIIESALELFKIVEVRTYPFSFKSIVDNPLYACEIFLYLSKEMFYESPDIEDLILNTSYLREEIDEIINKIREIII